MSHEATNWAIKQRGLKPSAKVVLWHLCDRYHPDHGCFPSLDTLADDCELSRRAVQDQVDILVKTGLVSVEKMPRKKGQMPRNRYRFAFEDDPSGLGQNLPMAKSAYGKSEHPPLANSDTRLGQNLPTNPVREPLREPVTTAREAAPLGSPVVVVAGQVDDPKEPETPPIPQHNPGGILPHWQAIQEILGCSGAIRPDGRPMAATNDQAEIERWDGMGISRETQLGVIRDQLAKARQKTPGFIPHSYRWLTSGMDEHKARKEAPAGLPQQTRNDRDDRRSHWRRLAGGQA